MAMCFIRFVTFLVFTFLDCFFFLLFCLISSPVLPFAAYSGVWSWGFVLWALDGHSSQLVSENRHTQKINTTGEQLTGLMWRRKPTEPWNWSSYRFQGLIKRDQQSSFPLASTKINAIIFIHRYALLFIKPHGHLNILRHMVDPSHNNAAVFDLQSSKNPTLTLGIYIFCLKKFVVDRVSVFHRISRNGHRFNDPPGF